MVWFSYCISTFTFNSKLGQKRLIFFCSGTRSNAATLIHFIAKLKRKNALIFSSPDLKAWKRFSVHFLSSVCLAVCKLLTFFTSFLFVKIMGYSQKNYLVCVDLSLFNSNHDLEGQMRPPGTFGRGVVWVYILIGSNREKILKILFLKN